MKRKKFPQVIIPRRTLTQPQQPDKPRVALEINFFLSVTFHILRMLKNLPANSDNLRQKP